MKKIDQDKIDTSGKPTKFAAWGKDAVFIVRHKGYDDNGQELIAPELILPNMHDDEATVPPHIVAMTAAMMRCVNGDEDFMNEQAEWLSRSDVND